MRSRSRRRWIVVGALAFAGCSSDGDTASSTTASTVSTTTITSAPPTSAPTVVVIDTTSTTTTMATPTVPGDVEIADLENDFTVAGRAMFTPAGATDVAITVELTGLDRVEFFVVLVERGVCADGLQADSSGALAYNTIRVGEEAITPVVAPLAELSSAPHAVLIASETGITPLACGDIMI